MRRTSSCVLSESYQYVRVTKQKRGREKQLFVSYQTFKPIYKDRLAGWISVCLKEVNEGVKESDLRLHAPSTRSLAYLGLCSKGLHWNQLYKQLFWARESTFSSFYLKDVWSAEYSSFVERWFPIRTIPSHNWRIHGDECVSIIIPLH